MFHLLAKSKLKSAETWITQALIDLETSHEELKTTIDEKENYNRLKEHMRMTKSNDEKNELSEKS